LIERGQNAILIAPAIAGTSSRGSLTGGLLCFIPLICRWLLRGLIADTIFSLLPFFDNSDKLLIRVAIFQSLNLSIFKLLYAQHKIRGQGHEAIAAPQNP
jgi:hypothetical protein